MLKMGESTLEEAITKLLNKGYLEGKIGQSWKKVKVVIIHRKETLLS